MMISKHLNGNRKNRKSLAIWILMAAVIFSVTNSVQAKPVSYAAELQTSRLNPVTDILILEADAGGVVHGTVYPSELPGNGYSVIIHNPPFTPVRSLVIGLTEGEDADGFDKIQLVMLVEDNFAAANQDVKFSLAFLGARHSLTIASLEAAVAGDASEMAWFTDTFFTGPAAAAVFDTGGSFTVAEFTALSAIGGAVTAGDWVLYDPNPILVLDPDDPEAESNHLTVVANESALSAGPFDIQLTPDNSGAFAWKKSVLNNSGRAMVGFKLEVGTGLGTQFSPADTNQIKFTNQNETREETGAFPGLTFSEAVVTFEGRLAPGESAEFIFFVSSTIDGEHPLSVRQTAVLADAGPAQISVQKVFTDSNDEAPVMLTLHCNNGTYAPATITLSPQEAIGPGILEQTFVVTNLPENIPDSGNVDTVCTVTETPVPGYDTLYLCPDDRGGSDSDPGCNELSDGGTLCKWSRVYAGYRNHCIIENSPTPVDVSVTKVWDVTNAGGDFFDTTTKVTIWCDGDVEILNGEYGGGVEWKTKKIKESDYVDGEYTFTVKAVPWHWKKNPKKYDRCWATEDINDSSIEIDNGCGETRKTATMRVSVGSGDSCTITNTVFFEGIPTLNQYGMAIMALLMLGMGFIGFRRLV